MSVLIKGMKMPHSCIGCRFCEHGSINEWDLYCGIDNKHVGNWDDKHINNGWRRPECPLVEVPPHGRLIDASEYINQMGNFYEEYWYDVLEEMPTIIEAEEGKSNG